MTNLRTTLLAMIALTLLVAGCTGAARTPTGTPTVAPPPTGASPGASPTPIPVAVTTPEQAVARVILAEKRLTGIAPFDANLIGQASWYTVAPASGVGAFVVNVRVGWGDCQAGCIDEHQWVYAVGPDGAVSVASETGPPVPGGAWPGATTAVRQTGIGGAATAGPVCPVEKIPPDPACAPRPVAGAVVIIRDASGAEVARTTTVADGTFFADVAPGGYTVEAQPVTGLMGTPGPQSVTVTDGVSSEIQLDYDTGIR